MNRRVVIVQEYVPHYREFFFEGLRKLLKEKHDVALEVIYSDQESENFIPSSLPWITSVPIIKKYGLTWHRWGQTVKGADLVIIPQEMKHLRCSLLLIKEAILGGKVAYWGHGKNFQKASTFSLTEKIKAQLSLLPAWWFAYNDMSAKVVSLLGYPTGAITSVQNTISIEIMRNAENSWTEESLQEFAEEKGLVATNLAIFTGGLYSEKRLSFLMDASDKIRAQIPDFELVIIGGGKEQEESFVCEYANKREWVYYAGKLGDQEKAPFWTMAKMLLMPGLVGLVIIDSFAFGVPIVTTDYPYHSPEIGYLENGVNGALVPGWQSVENYVDGVVRLFNSPDDIKILADGALLSGEKYTINAMIENMCSGIMTCLDS